MPAPKLIPFETARETLAGLRAFVRNSGLAEWKLPDAIEVIEAFPESGVGKVSRKKLRELLTR